MKKNWREFGKNVTAYFKDKYQNTHFVQIIYNGSHVSMPLKDAKLISEMLLKACAYLEQKDLPTKESP